jgi:hypothetical protein
MCMCVCVGSECACVRVFIPRPRRALRPRIRGCGWCHRPMSRASAAGVTWTSRTLKAGWAARFVHTSVIDAAGAIYVIGGYGETTYEDVWASTDGGARPDYVEGVVGGVLRVVLKGYWVGSQGGTQGY